jgi:hypothetical protein
MDYSNAKIYRIDCLITNEVYIGSTCQPTLAKRLAKHVANFKYWKIDKYRFTTSFSIIERGHYKISLIELFPCNSKDELSSREGYYIRNIKCVNKQIAGRTKKQWTEDNIDKIIEQSKEYREINKEKINKFKKTKIICECGGKYTNCHKARHFKTLKHLNVVADANTDPVESEVLRTTEDFITV